MPGWRTATQLFFAYTILAALITGRLPRRNRWLAIGGAGVGLLLNNVPVGAQLVPALEHWILPPVLLLLGYWASGLLFAAPMPRAERALHGLDRRLRIRPLAARTPRWLAELLELAYAGVYPLIPIALVIHLVFATHPNPDRFWTLILITDYICFGVLPWVQTRPPRALEQGEPWASRFRRFNLRLLGSTSIGVNTFPSGHAAEALAAAVLVLDAPWPIVAWMFLNAALISAGAVLGRYHFAGDALAGWGVTIVVWLAMAAR